MKVIKKYLADHKRSVLMVGIGLLLFIIFVCFVANDEQFYQSTIGRVTAVDTKYQKSEKGPNGEIEKYYVQKITFVIKNGPEKGRSAVAENMYAYSSVNSEKYQVGDRLFLKLTEEAGSLHAEITGVKRDVYVAVIFGIFLLGLLCIAGKQGVLTLVSFFANVAIFVFSISLYLQGVPIEELCILMIIIFSVGTLLLAGGLTKKSLGAIISTLLTLAVTFLIYKLVVIFIEEPPYQHMDYVFGPNDIESIFLTGILIGCLGAVMDVAITVHAAMSELLQTSEQITGKALITSIREIGYDIMGTMINVLLFSYISGSLPMIIMKIVNGYSLTSIIHFNVVFELIRFLVGSIGIVLAIPISGAIAMLLSKRGKQKC